MNTIEALEYLRTNPGSVVSTIEEERRIEMSLDMELFNYNKSTFIQLEIHRTDGTSERIDFSEWIQLHTEWEVTKEVKYYVKIKLPEYLAGLMGEGNIYLNYSTIDDEYFLSDKDDVGAYFQTSFTRDEIEEFGIAYPEVRREDLEFIEVVSE